MSTVSTKVTKKPYKCNPVQLRATDTKELDKIRKELIPE